MQSTGKIFWASFLTLIAAGMGFAIRSDVLAEWGAQFGFTQTELGEHFAHCIQVLGGIGCTWEHDAHLYLRRAHSMGRFLGGAERWLRRVTELTQDGVRRRLGIDLSEVKDKRPEIAAAVADR